MFTNIKTDSVVVAIKYWTADSLVECRCLLLYESMIVFTLRVDSNQENDLFHFREYKNIGHVLGWFSTTYGRLLSEDKL